MALDKNDDPQVVEVFARFGRAIYMANVVEDGLVRTLMQINFMKTKEVFIKAQGKGSPRSFQPIGTPTKRNSAAR